MGVEGISPSPHPKGKNELPAGGFAPSLPWAGLCGRCSLVPSTHCPPGAHGPSAPWTWALDSQEHQAGVDSPPPFPSPDSGSYLSRLSHLEPVFFGHSPEKRNQILHLNSGLAGPRQVMGITQKPRKQKKKKKKFFLEGGILIKS